MNYVIILDKPKGITSHQAVANVRKILGIKKAGHAGTLDPLATGVLIVCAGEATKITRFLADLDKEYVAVLKLGETTDTFDSEGEVLSKKEGFSFSMGEIEGALTRFRGALRQTPPMFSAVKIGGKPLYKLARKGIEVDRPLRNVTIRRLDISAYAPPFLEIRVLCSKGTYIRTLCNDIGEALGSGAHMTGLRRTHSGSFCIEDAVTLEELREMACSGAPIAHSAIQSPDAALSHMREIILTQVDYKKALNGMPFICSALLSREDGPVRMKSPSGNLFGIGIVSQGMIRIERLLKL